MFRGNALTSMRFAKFNSVGANSLQAGKSESIIRRHCLMIQALTVFLAVPLKMLT